MQLALLPNRTVVRFGLFAPPALFSSRLTAESHGCAVWPLRASGALFISPDCRIARLCALASSRLRRSFHLALLPNRTVVRFGLFAPPALFSSRLTSATHGCAVWPLRASGAHRGVVSTAEQASPQALRDHGAAAREQLALTLVHQPGLERLVVVVAGQMEETVDQEKVELEGGRNAEPPRLA